MIKIYGKESCPYCVRAKDLAASLGDYEYIDIVKEGISKEKLSEICGKEVYTVPQVFVDSKLIGGYTEFSNQYS